MSRKKAGAQRNREQPQGPVEFKYANPADDPRNAHSAK
jgi:hypothetical protein